MLDGQPERGEQHGFFWLFDELAGTGFHRLNGSDTSPRFDR